MDLTLTRTDFRSDGIFGFLHTDSGFEVARTLEHAYLKGAEWLPKIPPGRYACVRGPHRLAGMKSDFETFEVKGVTGHWGLLFHWGNFAKDSSGCVLLGRAIGRLGSVQMITDSRATFAAFMRLQAGVDEFTLTVE
jgi:hypothetical protein